MFQKIAALKVHWRITEPSGKLFSHYHEQTPKCLVKNLCCCSLKWNTGTQSFKTNSEGLRGRGDGGGVVSVGVYIEETYLPITYSQ